MSYGGISFAQSRSVQGEDLSRYIGDNETTEVLSYGGWS